MMTKSGLSMKFVFTYFFFHTNIFIVLPFRNKAIEEEPVASNNSGSEATAGSNVTKLGTAI